MASLSFPSAHEVQLRLGSHENAILAVVRRWSWWTRAEVEGQAPGDQRVTAVVLTAERSVERTIREILHLSFKLVFPAEGGEGVVGATNARLRAPYRFR